jgi:hypothetical protein
LSTEVVVVSNVVFLGLTVTNLLTVVIAVIAAGFSWQIFFNMPKRDRFGKGQERSPEDLAIFQQKGEGWQPFSDDEKLTLERDSVVHLEYEQIKNRRWAPKYQWAVELLLRRG